MIVCVNKIRSKADLTTQEEEEEEEKKDPLITA